MQQRHSTGRTQHVPHFRPRGHRLTADDYRTEMADRLAVGKPLRRELAGIFSARRGPYRVLYRVDDEQSSIWILRVDHRADVYRR